MKTALTYGTKEHRERRERTPSHHPDLPPIRQTQRDPDRGADHPDRTGGGGGTDPAFRIASEAGRYRLNNGNAAAKPHVTGAIEADLRDVVDTSRILMGVLGFPVLEGLSGPGQKAQTGNDTVIYHLKNKEMDARMRVQDEGYVVLKGSKAKKRLNKAVKPDGFINNTRRKLLQSGILREDGEHLIFTEDYLFKTPSGAGGVVYGGNCNGWKHWKTAKGQTLDELERQG